MRTRTRILFLVLASGCAAAPEATELPLEDGRYVAEPLPGQGYDEVFYLSVAGERVTGTVVGSTTPDGIATFGLGRGTQSPERLTIPVTFGSGVGGEMKYTFEFWDSLDPGCFARSGPEPRFATMVADWFDSACFHYVIWRPGPEERGR